MNAVWDPLYFLFVFLFAAVAGFGWAIGGAVAGKLTSL